MSAAPDIDVVIVGAGVVGLSIARALASAGREVLVVESEERAGEGISSRNSGVIHAGLYYPPGSLKARCCVRGRDLLYAYCQARGVPHRRLGKLVVAGTDEELPALRDLLARAARNGVEAYWRTREESEALEPAVGCAASLEVPSSGIVDVPELVMALLADVERAGGQVLCNTTIARVGRADDLWQVQSEGGDGIRCRHVVNAAGLGAIALAKQVEGMPAERIPTQYYAVGHYYRRNGASPFKRLIYPMPTSAGLGVHLGLDMAGHCRFGPDVRWVPEPDYGFDDSQRAAFAEAIRDWWPELDDEDLLPDFVGVRPKLVGPGAPSADFLVQGPAEHGQQGLVNLFGIESPGLTSSMALAEVVAGMC